MWKGSRSFVACLACLQLRALTRADQGRLRAVACKVLQTQVPFAGLGLQLLAGTPVRLPEGRAEGASCDCSLAARRPRIPSPAGGVESLVARPPAAAEAAVSQAAHP